MERVIDLALYGLGDSSRERAFRMNVTLCRHRACTDAEIAEFGGDTTAIDLAGAPIEHLWAKGFTPGPSSMPCAKPGHRPLSSGDPELWIPIDCGKCESCLARASCA